MIRAAGIPVSIQLSVAAVGARPLDGYIYQAACWYLSSIGDKCIKTPGRYREAVMIDLSGSDRLEDPSTCYSYHAAPRIQLLGPDRYSKGVNA